MPPRQLPLFRSDGQLRMLARLVLRPDAPATAAELKEASGMSTASLHRELMRAVDSGLVERDDSRRPHHFQASASSPLLAPLTALLRLSVGPQLEIAGVVGEVDGVEAAAIHGSWVTGPRPGSDIDLLVVGDVDRRALRARLRRLARTLSREIDLTLMTRSEFEELVASGEPFLRVLLERPRLDLVGDVGSLVRSHV